MGRWESMSKTGALVAAVSLCVIFSLRPSLAQQRKLLCGENICSAGGSPLFKGSGWTPGAKKFCLNKNPMNRVTLGHVSWSFLHTTTAYLPDGKLLPHIKQSFVNLMWTVRNIYACELCRGHFQKLMTDQQVVGELNAIETRYDA